MFRRYLAGQAASTLGDAALLSLFPLAAATVWQAGSAEMGTLGFAQSLPVFLLALPAGVLVDRVARRRLLVRMDGMRAICLLLLATALTAGAAGWGLFCAIAALTAAAALTFDVAAQSALPGMVSAGELVRANARLETARATGLIAGPAAIGWLLEERGLVLSLLAVTALYAVSALCYAGLPPEEKPAAAGPRPDFRRQIAEGLAFVWRQPALRAISLCALLWNVAWFALNTVFVLYAGERLGLGAADIGLAVAGQGIGLLIGSLIAAPLVSRLPVGLSLLIGPVLSALAIPLMMLAPAGGNLTSLGFLAAGEFCLGLGPSIWVVSSTSLRQQITPTALMGRVAATLRFATQGMRPVGAALGGAVGVWGGMEATLLCAALLFALCIPPIAFAAVFRRPAASDAVAAE
jgi:predicted MFS family arabinose efflux permease